MDKKLSDEQVDRIARNLLKDFAPDAETLEEIAESPRLWWSVRSRIETEQARRPRRMFFGFRPRVLAFGALAVLMCLGLTAFFLSFAKSPLSTVAERNPVSQPGVDVSRAPENLPSPTPAVDSEKRESAKTPPPVKSPLRDPEPSTGFVARRPNRQSSPRPNGRRPGASSARAEETKTDFIALSYAAQTDSGQILRVKVPSSMMVSLGVKTTVDKESELVSAEVVVGDDGLARAIRFIR